VTYEFPIIADGTKLSGFVTAEENRPPRDCGHCVWEKHDTCTHPVVMVDCEVPGVAGEPKPIEHDWCCNFFRSPAKTLMYVLRHGTTQLNEDNKFRGWIDVPLDKKGKGDAKEAAEFLKDKGISAIYCSDMDRAWETAQIVAAELGIEEVTTDFRLRPWNVGTLSGEDKTENKDVLEHHIDHPDQPIPGGESLHEFGDRTQEALDYYLNEARKEGVKLIVCHTSNVSQAENLVKGEGAQGRPESKDSVLPGGIIVIEEKKGKLSSRPILKEDGEAQYGS
jgi:broad specificity phosphatase PhoE